MTAPNVDDLNLGQLLCRPKPHDLSLARVESEPTGFQPGLDVDETRAETVDGDCSK